MDQFAQATLRKHAETAVKALQTNRMDARLVESREELLALVRELVPEGASVCSGGSMTLAECGVYDLLKNGPYDFYFRGRTDAEGQPLDVFRRAFSADWYFASSNAITMNGELYNVDGNGNRIAAMTYGPRNVVVIAGWNKIVRDLAEAEARVKAMAAPANAHRLDCRTGCRAAGCCVSCRSDERICCTTAIHGFQRIPGRIKVWVLPESLGY